MDKLSVIFVGTGEFGVPILNALAKSRNFTIPFVITGLDKSAGRHLQITSSPIKECVLLNKLIIHQPDAINDLKKNIIQARPNFLLVVDYGEIIKKDILSIPKYGAVNIHASLLPKLRGASPIQRAILNGEQKTGVTWILMNSKMDQGNIISQKEIPIHHEDAYPLLERKLSALATENTPNVLLSFAQTGNSVEQNESQASYCGKISKESGFLDIYKDDADAILRKIRAYQPWPGCWLFWNKKRLKIIQAAKVEQKIGPGGISVINGKILAIGTKGGAFLPVIVQPESKKTMPVAEFLKGQRDIPKQI